MSACEPFDRLLQTLRVSTPGATDELLSLQLFNVCDEFFRRTSAWQYEQDVELEENILEYDLAPPADSAIVRLMRVMHNNVPVLSTASTTAVTSSLGRLRPSEEFLDGDAAFAPAVTDLSGGVFSYAIYRPEFITLTGVPDAEGRVHPMKVIMALSVSRSCLEHDCAGWAMPEWMWDMFFGDWLDGTLSRLYGMPAKPWASPPLAIYHGKKFRNHMAYRKQEAVRGFVYNTPTWRFPRWA